MLAGYTPRVATHGQQGRELLREVWPDLLLTDLMMPHLDGAGLIRALRAEAEARGLPAPPVILMTASGLAVAQAAGADAILRKPFTMDELVALLRRFLAPPTTRPITAEEA